MMSSEFLDNCDLLSPTFDLAVMDNACVLNHLLVAVRYSQRICRQPRDLATLPLMEGSARLNCRSCLGPSLTFHAAKIQISTAHRFRQRFALTASKLISRLSRRWNTRIRPARNQFFGW